MALRVIGSYQAATMIPIVEWTILPRLTSNVCMIYGGGCARPRRPPSSPMCIKAVGSSVLGSGEALGWLAFGTCPGRSTQLLSAAVACTVCQSPEDASMTNRWNPFQQPHLCMAS